MSKKNQRFSWLLSKASKEINMKTKCEALLDKADECIRKGWKMKDERLRTFYYNASEGFKMKALKLTIDEANAPAESPRRQTSQR